MLTEYIQNHYWALSLHIFRLQAVIFPYFAAHLLIFVSLLFSSDIMGDDKKKQRQRPPKGLVKPRTVGESHHNNDVNQWKEPVMKQCIDEYYRELAANNNIPAAINRVDITKKYGISPSKLHHQVSTSKSSQQVLGYKHASRGRDAHAS